MNKIKWTALLLIGNCLAINAQTDRMINYTKVEPSEFELVNPESSFETLCDQLIAKNLVSLKKVTWENAYSQLSKDLDKYSRSAKKWRESVKAGKFEVKYGKQATKVAYQYDNIVLMIIPGNRTYFKFLKKQYGSHYLFDGFVDEKWLLEQKLKPLPEVFFPDEKR